MILVIIGPTGVGKTKLSIELAKKYSADIINADSMQVYKDLNIGTAKIKDNEKEGIKHHLLDCVDVNTLYTVYDYQKDGRSILDKLISKNKNVIIVGGTGLYIKALLYDYRFKKEPELNTYDNLTDIEIYNKLKEYDISINTHINNRKRNIRLLNKFELDLNDINNKDTKLYDFYMIGLKTDRDTLYKKINNRVDEMIDEGLIEEVKKLYDLNINSKAINTGIGYKELYKYFNKEISLEESIDLIKKNSRHYAKRQFTFFNNQFDNINWYDTDYNNFNNTVLNVYNDIEKWCKK